MVLAGILLVASAPAPAHGQAPTYGVGRAPTAEEIEAWDIAIAPDGHELPAGAGSAREGADVYAARCATCHGATGKEGPEDILYGGNGTLTTARPLKTVGSYWPYATTLWDYINRAMPFDRPTSMPVDDVYAVVAYVLFINGIVDEATVLDQVSLPAVEMPNRDGFVPDARPDVTSGATPAGERAVPVDDEPRLRQHPPVVNGNTRPEPAPPGAPPPGSP